MAAWWGQCIIRSRPLNGLHAHAATWGKFILDPLHVMSYSQILPSLRQKGADHWLTAGCGAQNYARDLSVSAALRVIRRGLFHATATGMRWSGQHSPPLSCWVEHYLIVDWRDIKEIKLWLVVGLLSLRFVSWWSPHEVAKCLICSMSGSRSLPDMLWHLGPIRGCCGYTKFC